MNKIYLASYPSSGSHWLAYIINELTNIPIYEYSTKLKNIFVGENSDYCIYKGHITGQIHEDEIDKCNGMILIIRNYKECILRRLKQHNNFSLNNFNEIELISFVINELKNKNYDENDIYGHSVDYIRMINLFNNFKNNKLVVYYEDLISKPNIVLNEIKNYFKKFNINVDINQFMKNFEEHRKNSLQKYPKIVPRTATLTEGKTKVSHSLELSSTAKNKIDTHIKLTFPNLFERYLSNYEDIID